MMKLSLYGIYGISFIAVCWIVYIGLIYWLWQRRHKPCCRNCKEWIQNLYSKTGYCVVNVNKPITANTPHDKSRLKFNIRRPEECCDSFVQRCDNDNKN